MFIHYRRGHIISTLSNYCWTKKNINRSIKMYSLYYNFSLVYGPTPRRFCVQSRNIQLGMSFFFIIGCFSLLAVSFKSRFLEYQRSLLIRPTKTFVHSMLIWSVWSNQSYLIHDCLIDYKFDLLMSNIVRINRYGGWL